MASYMAALTSARPREVRGGLGLIDWMRWRWKSSQRRTVPPFQKSISAVMAGVRAAAFCTCSASWVLNSWESVAGGAAGRKADGFARTQVRHVPAVGSRAFGSLNEGPVIFSEPQPETARRAARAHGTARRDRDR